MNADRPIKVVSWQPRSSAELRGEPHVEIVNLDFQYAEKTFRLHVPHLAIASGEKVALVGSSGGGKTTLLHLLAGILTPTSGSIRIKDICLDRLSEAERRQFRISSVGFIFQSFELVEYLNVLDNILHPFRLNPALKLDRDVRLRAVDLAEKVGIQDKLNRNIQKLSQGEKQRVAICRALLPQPQIILADEATSNLDLANKQHILEILFDYVNTSQASLIAATHDRELLSEFDRVIDLMSFHAEFPSMEVLHGS